MNGQLPGTAAWIGTVTSPAARSSVDCENAAAALLDLATSRAAAWTGKYTAWNMQEQADVWPGDVLAVAATSTGLNANLVVRTVEIEISCTVPGLAKYVVGFANDWADALAIKTSTTVPADVWLPQQPEAMPPLANLASLSVTGVSGSAIQVSANATPPANGGLKCAGETGRSVQGRIPIWCCAVQWQISQFHARRRSKSITSACTTARLLPIIRDFRAQSLSTSHYKVAAITGRRRGKCMTDFEAQVLADLSVLKNQMSTLLGDGNSGRIAAIEGRVGRHEQSLQRAKGFAVATGGLFTLIQLTIELLRRK